MDDDSETFFDEDDEIYIQECSSHQEIADYGNSNFLKLRDCGISIAAEMDYGE